MANYQIIESVFATQINGEDDKEIQVPRTLWERFFDPDPTRPLWQKTKPKIIKVPHYEPLMYVMGNKIITHPLLMPELEKQIERTKVFKW